MGYPDDEARGALRVSLGRTNTDDEVATATEVMPGVIASMQVGTASVARDPLGQGIGV
jgi:cysteine sulfinate desulfinase/cysteine desulfurase-like protein